MAGGAVAVGVCHAGTFSSEIEALRRDILDGRSGPLHFTYEDPVVSGDITATFPWARSVVVLAVNYLPETSHPASSGALVARFATSNHYRLLEEPMAAVRDHLLGAGHRAEAIFDDNRFLDRAAAVRSGIGWQGKSTMVLTPGSGPWTLIGSIVTDADLERTSRMRRTCGTCTACLPACPTGALDNSGLDARRCLSTWLQTGGGIPHWIRPLLGRRIYGCDDCLTSCPPGFPALERVTSPATELPFAELLDITDIELISQFDWWYVPHRDPRIVRRNVLVAAGNSGDTRLAGLIAGYLCHRSALLRGHAAWALAANSPGTAVDALVERLAVETEPAVREEVLLALRMIEDPESHRRFLADDESTRTGAPYPADMATMREPVTAGIRAIRNAGIPYQAHIFDYHRYPGAVGAAEAIGVDVHETVKTIVFETSNGTGVVALMNGDHEISTKNLARHIGVKSVKPAGADQARKWTGYEFGGTSPFGLRQSVPIVAHHEIPGMERIYINAGSRGFLVEIDPADMIRVLEPEVVDIAG
jgi:epoxyqueuosine reductase